MRSSKSRSRSKSNRQRTLGNIVNRVFDSSGPEGKVRGTPQQIIEKYLTLARDAQLSGDRVAEQSFFQHAEHYTRMLGEAQREMAERQGQNGQGQNGHHQPRHGDDEGQPRDNHGRDHQPRDNQGRDHQGRDNQGRDHQGRDSQPRDQQSRDHQNRDHQRREPEAEARPVLAETRPEPQPESRPEPVQPALPDVSAGDDQGSDPVATPESQDAPKTPRPRSTRARTPRSPAGTTPTRSRRKPAAEGDAPAPATEPQGDPQD